MYPNEFMGFFSLLATGPQESSNTCASDSDDISFFFAKIKTLLAHDELDADIKDDPNLDEPFLFRPKLFRTNLRAAE